MSASELKSKIISKISAIEDVEILQEIFRLIDLESGINSVYRLSDDERKAVESGLRDINEGKVVSSQVADSMIKEWLKK